MEEMFYLHTPKSDTALPEKIYIEPTSICNLHCTICFRNQWIGDQVGNLDLSAFHHLATEIQQMSSVKEVFFAGMGEPLFHPNICDMVSMISNTKKKSLLSNGTLLDEKMSHKLLEAGLNELWISMDGFTRESYEQIQKGSQFEILLQNLTHFNQSRKNTNTRLCITFVVTPDNKDELKLINTFADRFEIDELNISHMIPSSPISKENVLYDEENIPTGRMYRFAPIGNHHEEYICPFISTNCTFVRYDGAVVPCMQLLHECYTYLYEEKRRIKSFSYGNIHQNTLLECWNCKEYVAFRHRVNTFYFPFCPVCWGCDDRKENLHDCFLGEAPTCGACLWANGKIFCP